KDAKARIEQALRYEFAAEPLLKDFEYAKAIASINKSFSELVAAAHGLVSVPATIPPGNPARADMTEAFSDVSKAIGFDKTTRGEALVADGATGDQETKFRKFAMASLNQAIDAKLRSLKALTAAIAAGDSS